MYNVAHFKRRNSRGRAKMEKKRVKKGESIRIKCIHCNVSFYIFEIDAAGKFTVKNLPEAFGLIMLNTGFSL